eukprot:GGOE01041192.1.p1 GENE.GGOE01041192.1~~GGOE01041192.1.p1  ORF type:complete len:417 (+),score=156.73 GGOE01041192.1:79-1329(+)
MRHHRPPPQANTADLELQAVPEADGEAEEAEEDVTSGARSPLLDRPISDLSGLTEILMGNCINGLLLVSPFGVAADFLGWNSTAVFFCNFFPIIPLAWLLGRATEEVSLRTGQVIGGFLNATFGNAVEAILAIVGLRRNMVQLIQASLLGSVLSNMLLVLGCAFFAGGLYHKQQTFNTTIAIVNCSLLFLACMSLSLPTAYSVLVPDPRNEIPMSRIAAAGLALTYSHFLFFQMGSHSHLFKDAEEEEEEPPTLSLGCSVLLMALITVLVSAHTEFLLGAVEGTVRATGLSEHFIGIILLPVIGNAAEHVSAVTVAMKNKMTLAVNIALGSATQISVCVIPMTVVIGWAMGVQMDLNFHPFEVLTLVIAVILVAELARTGTSNWLAGSILIMAYLLIGTGFYFLPDAPNGDGNATT